MGAKYSSQATSGYNASPPSDDGTQAASNLITWAGIKSKLADILKTFGEAINTALVSAFDYSVRQISASDSTVASDHMRCVEIAPTVTTAVTVSLGDAATMTTVYRVFIKNSSAINQTVGRVTVGDTIDGTAANVTLAPGEGRIFQTNSTPNGYLTNGRFGPFVDTNPIAVGSSDGTKKVRLEVDGLTTGITRVITVPDADTKIGPSVIAAGRNIAARTNSVTPNTKLDITADEILLKDSNSLPFLAQSVSCTIDFGTVGANGLDTGSQAASTWYYGWVIAKPDGTIAGLGSTSATSPTMPAGYTFKALATAARSDVSTHFTGYRQLGNEVTFDTRQQVLTNGAATSETAASVASIVPSIAQYIHYGERESVTTDGSGVASYTVTYRTISGSDQFVFTFSSGGLGINAPSVLGSRPFTLPNISQQFFYLWTLTSGSNPLLDVFVVGFKLPLGGE